GRAAGRHGDQGDLLLAAQLPLQRGNGHEDLIVLVGARRRAALGAEYADDPEGDAVHGNGLADGVAVAAEQPAADGLSHDAQAGQGGPALVDQQGRDRHADRGQETHGPTSTGSADDPFRGAGAFTTSAAIRPSRRVTCRGAWAAMEASCVTMRMVWRSSRL